MMGKKEDKQRNRGFLRSEYALQRAVFSLIGRYRGGLTARQVAKVAGLSRRTFYRHHSSIYHIVEESEEAVLEDFSADFDMQSERLVTVIADPNTRLLYALMVFMAHRQDVFCIICADINNQNVLYRMVERLYPRLEIMWLPKGSSTPLLGSERADMLICIMVEILCEWGTSTHCNVRKANRYIQRLLRAVSDAAANRLP